MSRDSDLSLNFHDVREVSRMHWNDHSYGGLFIGFVLAIFGGGSGGW